MRMSHTQEVFDLEDGEKVIIRFDRGDETTCEVISPYSSGEYKHRVILNPNKYPNHIVVERGNTAVLKGSPDMGLGYVAEVKNSE